MVAFRDQRTHCVLLAADTLATHTVRYGKAELVTQCFRVYSTYMYQSVSSQKSLIYINLSRQREENEQAEPGTVIQTLN